MKRVINDFKDRISSYDKDYDFSQEEVLNILERYEIKYENAQTSILDKIKQDIKEIEQAREDLDVYDKHALWYYVSRVDTILTRLIRSVEEYEKL